MHTLTLIAATATGTEVAERFLTAVATRDLPALAPLLTPDVRMRALLPRAVFEVGDAVGVIGAYRTWLGTVDGFHALATEHRRVVGREFLRYRLRLRPDWAPDTWHELEQVGFCRVRDGRITRIDLVCTGYFPVSD